MFDLTSRIMTNVDFYVFFLFLGHTELWPIKTSLSHPRIQNEDIAARVQNCPEITILTSQILVKVG